MKGDNTRWLLIFAGVCSLGFLGSWGFRAHRDINQYAIYALPQPLQVFYLKHWKEIRERAVEPDQFRRTNPLEAPRHFIDLEYYLETPGFQPGLSWELIRELVGDSVYVWGTLPWTIEWMFENLVEAFREQDVSRIVILSAYLGHYVADAHVPLHTTVNYDGQLTGQQGIHALWESRIPEYFSEKWNRIVGRAVRIDTLRSWIWEIILSSHHRVDSVLVLEREARRLCPGSCADTVIRFRSGERQVPSRKFCFIYDSLMQNMVERRWRQAIHSVASIWYTAWLEAGSPYLPGMPEEDREGGGNTFRNFRPHPENRSR